MWSKADDYFCYKIIAKFRDIQFHFNMLTTTNSKVCVHKSSISLLWMSYKSVFFFYVPVEKSLQVHFHLLKQKYFQSSEIMNTNDSTTYE